MENRLIVTLHGKLPSVNVIPPPGCGDMANGSKKEIPLHSDETPCFFNWYIHESKLVGICILSCTSAALSFFKNFNCDAIDTTGDIISIWFSKHRSLEQLVTQDWNIYLFCEDDYTILDASLWNVPFDHYQHLVATKPINMC